MRELRHRYARLSTLEINIDRWDRPLGIAGSESRAAVLVRACGESTEDEARALLAQWFNVCDALAPWSADLRKQFERVGYVTDTPDSPHVEPSVVVYRAAWSDDDPHTSRSVVHESAVAEKFARIFTGPRGWFLGIKRDDAEMFIWKGTATRVLGHFNGRNEHEVIVGEMSWDVEPISKLVTVKGGESDGREA